MSRWNVIFISFLKKVVEDCGAMTDLEDKEGEVCGCSYLLECRLTRQIDCSSQSSTEWTSPYCQIPRSRKGLCSCSRR